MKFVFSLDVIIGDRVKFVFSLDVIIIMIMDSSCTAQIFRSRKLSALAHTIHANIPTDINIIHTH